MRFVLLVLTLLAGCSSSGSDVYLTALRDDLTGKTQEPTTPNTAASISRAQIDALGVALIRVTAPDTLTPEPNLLVAFRKSGAQVTYVLRAERRLILHGGLIQSTNGFGDNLSPIAVGTNDPIAYPRPLDRWPSRVVREYTFADRGPGTPVRVMCTYRPKTNGVIEIVERQSRVQTMHETCKGGGLDIANRYDVDVKSGAIWRSVQWSGPQQGRLIVEVLEPLTDG